MNEIITDELIQYKQGFMQAKNDIIELTRIGKIIDFEDLDIKMPEWYIYGYRDSAQYFYEQINNKIDIATIRIRDVIKEQFAKRVIIYNQEKGKEIPISTFKI